MLGEIVFFFEIFWNFDFEKQANSAVTVWISSLWWEMVKSILTGCEPALILEQSLIRLICLGIFLI